MRLSCVLYVASNIPVYGTLTHTIASLIVYRSLYACFVGDVRVTAFKSRFFPFEIGSEAFISLLDTTIQHLVNVTVHAMLFSRVLYSIMCCRPIHLCATYIWI